MILLDTHAVIWLAAGSERLGKKARAVADESLRTGELAVSAISFWETAMLRERGRVEMRQPVDVWRRQLLDSGLVEIPVDGTIAIAGAVLPDFHGDPADRLIVATVLQLDATLVTADERIHSWNGRMRRVQAAR